MKKSVAALAVLAFLLSFGVPATADHANNDTLSSDVPITEDVPASKRGTWSFVANYAMGPGEERPLGTDVETFVRGGKRHTIVGSMTTGFRLFRYDTLSPTTPPTPLGEYASAFPCNAVAPATLIQNKLEHDEDQLDTLAVGGWQDDVQVNGNGTIASIATDADGRCHDTAGAGAEIVDISNLSEPHLFHLTRHFGEAHNTTIDKRRGLIYISSSDTQLNAIDIVDFRSCKPPATNATNFANCRPVVARYQFPVPHAVDGDTVNVPAAFKDTRFPNGLTAGVEDESNYGCHDISVRGNYMYCAAINSTVIFDISGVTQKNGVNCVSLTDLSCKLTGTHLTSQTSINADKNGATNLPPACPIKDGTPGVGKPNSVTDCDVWGRPTGGTQAERYEKDHFMRANLRNANVRPVSVIRHAGRTTTKSWYQDIQISHEADATYDGKVLMITDERGGGTSHVCDGDKTGGGGIWFYDIRNPAQPKLLMRPDGRKGVFITRYAEMPGNCTVHVIQQIPGRNILVAAWYIEGTHVVRFTPNLANGTVSFLELGHYIPAGSVGQANTWTSMPVAVNNGWLYIHTGDMTRGTDVLAFKLG